MTSHIAPARQSSDAGFTMIELLLVMTIILVITSILSPTFRMTPTREVENAANLVATHLEMARSNALGERRVVVVELDESAGRYVAYADHDGDDSVAVVSEEVDAFPAFGRRDLEGQVVFGRGSAAAVPDDATAGAITLPMSRLEFDGRGVPTPWGTAGTIYLTHSRDVEAVSAVSVYPSGAVKTWRWWPTPGEWR